MRIISVILDQPVIKSILGLCPGPGRRLKGPAGAKTPVGTSQQRARPVTWTFLGSQCPLRTVLSSGQGEANHHRLASRPT